MRTYTIRAKEVQYLVYEVVAENEQEAMTKWSPDNSYIHNEPYDVEFVDIKCSDDAEQGGALTSA